MRKTFAIKRRKRKNAPSFNPNRDFVNQAVEDFLKKGGKITQVQDNPESFEEGVVRDHRSMADDFLLGQ